MITLAQKRAHFREVQDIAAAQAALAGEIERRAAGLAGETGQVFVLAPGRAT